jgi:hypothetical protein
MIQLCPFKKKEGGERRSPLGGQWKEKEKVPMLGGQWKEKEKVPMLKGQWKEKEKVPFHLFSLSPQVNLRGPSCCSFELTFYFTMVLGCYLRIISLFLGL